MFEQSMLAEKGKNKSWSFFASLSLELVGICLVVIIPLLTGDHLPHFTLKGVTLGAPVRRMDPKPAVAHSNNASSPPAVFRHAPRIYSPVSATKLTPPDASGPEMPDLPGFMPIATGNGTSFNPLGDTIGKQLAVNAPSAKLPEKAPPRAATGPVRISEGVLMAKLIRRVVPVYPPLARQARISGVVRLIGIIGKDGSIRNLQLVSGHPLLTKAALDAVQQWVYQPTLLSGEAVEVIAPIDVVFTLSQ